MKASLSIDPRTLFFINIIFSVTVFIVSGRIGNHLNFAIAFALMLISGMYRKSFRFLLVYGGITLFDFLFTMYSIGRLQEFTGLVFYMTSKLIPIIMVSSILINRIKTNEVIAALDKINLPKGLMVSIVVSLRFIPTIREEFRNIKDSMSMRGIDLSFRNMVKKPILTMEYAIVPLLFRSLKIAEELTATALVRGIESETKRSSYYDVSFTKLDYQILVFVFLSTILVFFWDIGIIDSIFLD